MITINDLSLRRGTKLLLEHAKLTIFARQKIGIIGKNGCGKSSFFSLMLKQNQPDSGDLFMPQNIRIAHLSQDTPTVPLSALDYVVEGDIELKAIENELRLAEQSDDHHKIASLHGQYADSDGYTVRARAAKLLYGLGFANDEHDKFVSEFSGGWRMRLNLAQTLMRRSDLLLLDEPTNHLDLETIIWLEKWLTSYQGTLIFISHDRDFLDAVVTHIVHFDNQQLVLYTGDYSSFEKQRAEKLSLQNALFNKQQKKIAHLQEFIQRFKAKASKAKQAQSRVKALERMDVLSAAQLDSPFEFEFPPPLATSNPLLRLEDMSVGYKNKVILDDISLDIAGDERIGLLGINGAGKSTLIKLMAGIINPFRGQRLEARNLNIGYFAQHQVEQLDLNESPLLHLQRVDPKATTQQLRSFLGGFAFNGDMAMMPITNFSGGEKSRLALAILVWLKPNLLLLDEPTNHLDLEMRSALTLAMQTYQGAMVIVSHDRHLLRSTTNQLWLVADGKVGLFEGDLSDYQTQTRIKSDKAPGLITAASTPKDKHRLRKELESKVVKIEKKLVKWREQLAVIESFLADPTIYKKADQTELNQKSQQRQQLTREIDGAEQEWLSVMHELEGLG